MKNSTLIDAALMLSVTYMFVNMPSYLGGFLLGGLMLVSIVSARKADNLNNLGG